MARLVELKDPDDPIQVSKYINRKARQSTSKPLQRLLETIPTPVRDARLRCNGATFAITNLTQNVAAATHLRGQIAETQCNNCQEGDGPFEDCVILVGYDDLTKACCTNCQWMLFTTRERAKGKLCTHAIGSCDLSGLV